MVCDKSKILIFGATGYLGKFMVQASLSLNHPTYAYVRPVKPNTSLSKLQLLVEFQSLGVTLFQGELDDNEMLLSVIKQVDVVISTLGVPQYLDQLKIISALKEAGHIKRFIPSEYGNEADRVNGLPPFEAILENKRKIRRATEEAGLPYTFISANSFAAYFVHYLLHPHEKSPELTVYGTGQAKFVMNYEKDVAVYTVKAATDPRAINRLIICRPPQNILSQLDLVATWQKKTGQPSKIIHLSDEEIVKLSEILPYPECIRVSILHNILIKGDQMSFELTEDDLEASKLYPDYKYTSVDSILDMCLTSSFKPKLATFA